MNSRRFLAPRWLYIKLNLLKYDPCIKKVKKLRNQSLLTGQQKKLTNCFEKDGKFCNKSQLHLN